MASFGWSRGGPDPGRDNGEVNDRESSDDASNPLGVPDLQGVWNSGTQTPLERPKELAGKQTLTDEEAARLEEQAAAQRYSDIDPKTGKLRTSVDGVVPYNQFWLDQGTKVVRTRRTSLVIDPPDGQIPPFTAEAQKRLDANMQRWRGQATSYLDRDTGERCITEARCDRALE